MNLIQHYDAESDLEFEIPEFDPSEYEEVAEFLAAHEAEVNEAILSALHGAVEFELQWAPTFAIRGTEEVFGIHRSEFAGQAERLTEYYSALEEYELCIVLQEIKTKL